MKASFYTLGCRVNQYESDAIAEALKRNGFEIVPFGEKSDIIIINSCTVTAESDRKSRQIVRRAQKLSPTYGVVLTGCYAEAFREDAEKTGAFIVPNSDKSNIIRAISKHTGTFIPVDDKLYVSTPKRVRTFVKIEDGCDNKCAYCIINRARGPVVSRPACDIVREIETIVRPDSPEIILTGIETGSYGKDLPDASLSDLLAQVNSIDGVKRLTLGSLDPSIFKDSFIEILSSLDKLLPHFHLSIQSGCTKTLNKMRRKYTAEMALANIQKIRAAIPEVTFSADIIVGFPGETEEDFNDTVEFCKEVGFIHLHIFPYSKRKGTEAASMENQVPEDVKRARCEKLKQVGDEIYRSYLESYIYSHKDKPIKVLCEKWEDGISNGHSEHYVECDVETAEDKTGEILEVIPYKIRNDVLICK